MGIDGSAIHQRDKTQLKIASSTALGRRSRPLSDIPQGGRPHGGGVGEPCERFHPPGRSPKKMNPRSDNFVGSKTATNIIEGENPLQPLCSKGLSTKFITPQMIKYHTTDDKVSHHRW